MRRQLFIPDRILRKVVDHCMEERPLEACGILVGQAGVVARGYATDNKLRSPVLYEVDERQLFQILKEMDREKEEILAIYHSHTETDPMPSKTDIQKAHWPESFYMIVSLKDPKPRVRAYRIIDGQAHPAEIGVLKDDGTPAQWRDIRRAAADVAKHTDIT
jgi:[CysO sulfur-carrier protein]-S-L-cysteine hydrolase